MSLNAEDVKIFLFQGQGNSSSDLGSLYTFDTLSELFLQLAHHTPYLTLQWLYVLLLMDWCPQDIWARALLSGGKEASPGMGNIFEGVRLTKSIILKWKSQEI